MKEEKEGKRVACFFVGGLGWGGGYVALRMNENKL